MNNTTFICLALLLAVSVRHGDAAQIVVSPQGSDAANGAAAHPVATPERAQVLAQAAIKRGEAVQVVLHGGTYELRAPLALGAQDSGTAQAPVVWRAAAGESVRLSGGRDVSGWRPVRDSAVRAKLGPSARDRVLELDLEARGITDYGEMSGGFSQNGSTGLEVFMDDAPLHVSRYPNQGFIPITEIVGEGGATNGVFRAADPRVARWAAEKDPHALGYWRFDWADQRQKIASIDPETLTLTLAPPAHTFGYAKGQYFYGFNLLGEIDAPGEWYLDRETGVLYALPPESRAPRRTMVSLLPGVVTLTGASHITLRGLTLEGARGHDIVLTDCEDCSLVACTLRNCGKWGARVEGGRRCAVRGCDILGTGDGGVSLDGGDRKTLTPSGHTVENCHIHHYSRWDRTYQAGISLNGVGCRAEHNLIHDAPHQAMNFGGNDHVIAFNEIHNVCEETNDAGAIYAWNDWAGRGNQVKNNYIHHVYGREARGANGVYLDDNFSSATIEGNVFESLVRPIHLGGGRDHRVLNNLFVDCFSALHIDARGLGWRANGYDDLKKKLELWPYRQPPWSTRYPQLLTLLADEPMAPKGIVVARNIIVNSPWDDIEGKAKPYVSMRQNILDAPRSVLLKDGGRVPQVDAKAPAVRAVNFAAIPVRQIGLFKSADRATWPVAHAVTVRAWPKQGGAAQSPHPGPPARVARLARAPQADGVVSPGEYPGDPLPLAETPGRTQITPPPGRAWLAHDARRLYVAVTIPIAKPDKLVPSAAWGAADGVEMAFRLQRAQAAGPTFLLQGFPDGRHLASLDAGTPPELASALLKLSAYAAHVGPDSWTAEWSVPLKAAGIAVRPGLALGFNLGVRRTETDEWLCWTGTGRENWRLDGAGRIVFD